MSEYGNHGLTAAMKATEKTVESTFDAVFKMIKYFTTREDRQLDKALKRYKVAEMALEGDETIEKVKATREVSKLIEQVKNGKTSSHISADLLMKTGKPLQTCNVNFTDEEMNEFNKLTKQYGVVYGSLSKEGVDGSKTRTLIFMTKDFHHIDSITQKMTENKQIRGIDQLIDEIKAKGVLTDEDLQQIKKLELEKEKVLLKGSITYNQVNSKAIFAEISGQMEEKSNTFEDALNRVTDRDFSRDKPYYVCERTNPQNFIELKSNLDTFNGKKYTVTTYSLYKDGVFKETYSDKRFPGRDKLYWYHLKQEMQADGGFSDDMVYFGTQQEFEQYKSLYIQASKEMLLDEKIYDFIGKDYSAAIEKINDKLDEKNLVYQAGEFINRETGEKIELESLSEEVLLAKRYIDQYTKLNEHQSELIELKNISNDFTLEPHYPAIRDSIYKELEALKECELEYKKIEFDPEHSIFSKGDMDVCLKDRDYDEIIQSYENELSKLEFSISQGDLIDLETGEIFTKDMLGNFTDIDESSIRHAQAVVLHKQIMNARNMSEIQFDIAEAKLNGDTEGIQIKEQELNKLFEQESKFRNEKNQVESIRVIDQIEDERLMEIEKEYELYHEIEAEYTLDNFDFEQSLDSWYGMIEEERIEIDSIEDKKLDIGKDAPQVFKVDNSIADRSLDR